MGSAGRDLRDPAAGPAVTDAAITWDERLRVPWWWWVVGIVVAITFVVAVWAFLGNAWGLAMLVVAVLVVVVALLGWSRARVQLTESEFVAGRARLGLDHLGLAEALDVAQSEIALRDGVRDWLALRPWLKRVVRVRIDDPADPHPHWLVSTADPEGLAERLERARALHRTTVGADQPAPAAHRTSVDPENVPQQDVALEQPSTAVTGRAPAAADPDAPAGGHPMIDRPEVLISMLDPDLPVPGYAKDGDAGADICAAQDVTIAPGQRVLVPTGVAIALPEGYACFVHPRSGLAARSGVTIVNAPGTVDSGYRGEIKINLLNTDASTPVQLRRGDRIAQLVIQRVAHASFVPVDELPSSERGDGGHGSTGGVHEWGSAAARG